MTINVKLSDVAIYRKEFITIDNSYQYKRCRVQLHRRGIVLRDRLLGQEIKTKKQRLCKTDDFLVAEMDAKFGGYGIVPSELDGAIVSSHYYLFELDKTKILPQYFSVLIDTEIIQSQIKAKGSTNYSRVSPSEVADFEIPCPSLIEQQRIISIYIDSKKIIQVLSKESTNQSSYLKKLRQAILQEAIEGKLTADWRKENPVRKGDPDYDAEALLEKIQAEKEKLIKEGKIKKQKPLAPIKPEEVPFELPDGWVWTRLGESGWIDRGKSPVYSEKSNSIVLNQKCIRWFQIETIWGKSVSEKWLNSIDKFIFTKIGDILVNSTGEGTIGRAAIVDTKSANLLYDSHVLKYSTLINSRHILTCLNSTFCQSQIKECKGAKTTKQTELGVDNLSNLLIPLPPLAEQQAIVDRVEKLLSMVDELEKQVSERKEQSEQLMQAVLREAFEGKPTISDNKTLEVNNA